MDNQRMAHVARDDEIETGRATIVQRLARSHNSLAFEAVNCNFLHPRLALDLELEMKLELELGIGDGGFGVGVCCRDGSVAKRFRIQTGLPPSLPSTINPRVLGAFFKRPSYMALASPTPRVCWVRL